MSELFSKTIERVAEDYYEALMQYGWPGNVRELRNAIKYSLTLLDGTVLRARHLAGFFSSGSQEVIPQVSRDGQREQVQGGETPRDRPGDALSEVERSRLSVPMRDKVSLCETDCLGYVSY